MNQRLYLLLPLIIVCLSIPPRASAQYTLTKISGDGQTGYPGQTLDPFVVEVRDQNGLASGVLVEFEVPEDGFLSAFLVSTVNGQAASTLTLGRRVGTTTVTVSVQGDEVVFEARAISPSSSLEPTTPSTAPPPPKILLGISGDGQTGLPGQTLEPFVIQVRTQEGTPSEGVSVIFFVLTGGGSLSATVVITNSNGRAASTLTLGSEPGPNRVQVSFPGTSPETAAIAGTESRVVFSAEAITAPPPPPMPATLERISGDNQMNLIGEVLPNPFVIEVRDQYNAPMEGVTVTFTVTAGDGLLSTTSATTDSNGQAESTLTFGNEPGTTTVEASVGGIAQIVVFRAEAILPPPMPTTLERISGDNQMSLIGEALTNPFIVEVRDQYSAPMEGITVTFTVTAGGGALSTASAMTDSSGQAESILTFENEPGTTTVEVSAEGISETIIFHALAESLTFNLSVPSGISMIHVPLKVTSVDGITGTIESVADLYAALGGVDTVHWLITHDPQTQTWHGYFGDADRGSIADRVLTDEAGILADIKTPISIRLAGDALGMDGTNAITLNPGLNLVGLPLNDPKITRVSDLLTLEGIGVIIVTDNGEFKLVGRADDPGDIPITGGQGFILIVQQIGTIPIIGTGWNNVP